MALPECDNPKLLARAGPRVTREAISVATQRTYNEVEGSRTLNLRIDSPSEALVSPCAITIGGEDGTGYRWSSNVREAARVFGRIAARVEEGMEKGGAWE